MRRPPLPPNQFVETGKSYANEFLKDTTDETNNKIRNLITRNTQLGGDPRGFTYAGIRYSNAPATEFIPEIDDSLKEIAEALYHRGDRLQKMREMLAQTLTTILKRCNGDIDMFRNALPDRFVEVISLSAYPRTRPEGFLLKAQPLLAASYRSIDEAINFRNRYRLLD